MENVFVNLAELNLDDVNYKKATDFFSIYELEALIDIASYKTKTFVGDLSTHVCRFCKKSKAETTFRKKAHLVPQFLGNRFLLSAHECDDCNKLFGDLYENDFANFIGPMRPFLFFAPSKNNKNPKHKETILHGNEEKTKISIQAGNKRNVQIYYEHPYEDSVNYDKENKKMTINAQRKPYIPLFVYKMLVKMALSIISDEDVSSFEQTIQFLLDNSQNEIFKGFPLCHVYMHSLYGRPIFPSPLLYLYKKKVDSENCPSKTFIMFSGNHSYQIFIPLNEKDNWMQGNLVKLYPYPLLFDKSLYEKGLTYSAYQKLMDSFEKKCGEPQQLIFSYKDAEFNSTISTQAKNMNM